MTSTIQFSGISSGLDTASIISALMEVEAQPQTTLKNRVSTEQTKVSALQQINTALSSLAESAKSFATGSTWTQLSATSTSSAVTVTASSSAAKGTFEVAVGQLAQAAHTTLSAATLAGATGTLTITGTDGTALATVDAGSSLADIAAAINAGSTGSGLQAQLIKDAVGGPVLLLSAVSTGAASNFTLSADGIGPITTTNGIDAQITVGGVAVSSPTNTFDDLMPGIDVTLAPGTAPGTTASITIAADGASRATAMSAFIGQINSVLTEISDTTAYGTITAGEAATGGGPLPGDATLRAVANQLVETIFPTGNGDLSQYGLSVDRYGQLTFDSAAFTAAYEADPGAVQAAFAGEGGFAERVQAVAEAASDAYDGSISQYITSENDQIARYNDQIAEWDDRLAAKQASLEQIYTALETTLSKLTSQQSWLTSALESLDDGWSTSD